MAGWMEKLRGLFGGSGGAGQGGGHDHAHERAEHAHEHMGVEQGQTGTPAAPEATTVAPPQEQGP